MWNRRVIIKLENGSVRQQTQKRLRAKRGSRQSSQAPKSVIDVEGDTEDSTLVISKLKIDFFFSSNLWIDSLLQSEGKFFIWINKPIDINQFFTDIHAE